MSYDLYIFDGSSSSSSVCRHSSPEMLSSDTTATTDVPFFCNNDVYPYLDVLNAITDSNSNSNPVDDSVYLFDHCAPHLLSSSPPSHQLETLTLSQTVQSTNSSVLSNGFPNFSAFDSSDVKTELFFDGSGHNQTGASAFMARSYSAVEKYMQRSFSSNSVESKPSSRFNSPFDPLVELSNLHNQTLSSPDNGFFCSHMRRVCSTGDLQSMRRDFATQRSYSNPSATEISSSSPSFTDEPNFKVGRYSAEERRERISKYRAKRTQRNFTKTIKYACRKTLADNRPRIRGRFARNDEVVDTPKKSSPFAREDDDDLWNLDGLHEEDEAFVGSFVQPQSQYTTSLW